MSLKGVDVSSHNGSVDWKQVKGAGYKYVICKATEGMDWRDPTFTKGRRDAIRHQGLIFGAYHFARPSSNFRDARREAEDFVTAAKSVGWNPAVDLPLVLDVETTKISARKTLEWCDAFCGFVKNATGRGCITYSGSWFFVDQLHLGRAPKNGNLLWFAAYVSRPRLRILIARMRGFKPLLWQYTSTGRVPGVSGQVDVNTTLVSDSAFHSVIHK